MVQRKVKLEIGDQKSPDQSKNILEFVTVSVVFNRHLVSIPRKMLAKCAFTSEHSLFRQHSYK